MAHREPGGAASLEEIVAQKLAQFCCSRREFAYSLAKRHHVSVPAEVEQFFAAAESGNWEEIEAAFKKINGGDSSASWTDKRAPEVNELWPAIIDAYGVAEQVHLWPAQKLLDYGNAALGALQPGMVYVGGTDNGRWIPELLNDTAEGGQHIIVTQNGLAASDYLDYLRLQYDGRLANLSDEDSQRAFQDYMTDAQKRLQHDQQFPDEPEQVRPGEDIKVVDGKYQVSGRVAVMAINERLLGMLMQKNPDLSFAIEESFPLAGTYANALPLGPLMQLQGVSGQNPFDATRASQTVDYWRSTTQQLLSDPEATASDTVLRAYSHQTAAAGNLLAAHGFTSDAEAAYRLATQLYPANPEAVTSMADVLSRSGRQDEARQVLEDFSKQYPEQKKSLEQSEAWRLLWSVKK